MTREQQAAEVVATLRRCVVALDGHHSLALVNPLIPQSDRNNYAFCIWCLKSGDDL